MELTSKQRAQLRAIASGTEVIVTVGKAGIGENLIIQTDRALEAREIVKGRVLDNCLTLDVRQAAAALSAATGSAVVQTVGRCFVLYRPSRTRPQDRRIRLAPRQKGAEA